MRQLNGAYSQRYNRRHGKVGHLFRGRFNAVLVEKEGRLLELARYVVLNPVRAGTAAEALFSACIPCRSGRPNPTARRASPSMPTTDRIAKNSIEARRDCRHRTS